MKIIVTSGKIKKKVLVDNRFYNRLTKHKWYYDRRYVVAAINGRNVLMHRMILEMSGESMKGLVTDHINHDTLDNRLENLRSCTQRQNCMNRFSHKGSSSVYKGVCKRINHDSPGVRWHAQIIVDGIRKHLGYYDTEVEAAEEYNTAALHHFGEFSCLNKMRIV